MTLGLELEIWQSYLIAGLVVLLFVAFSGMVLIRTGRSPLWCLALLIPVVQIIALWALAFADWPNIDESKADNDAHSSDVM